MIVEMSEEAAMSSAMREEPYARPTYPATHAVEDAMKAGVPDLLGKLAAYVEGK